jgi:hypothetical protein
MENPWEKIALSDYENHMRLDSVCQLQAMNAMMKDQLSRHPAETVMLLGIAGGNGLEHIDPRKVQTLYGVDINQKYLTACAERYPELKNTLVCIQADLTASVLELPPAELVIANLLVEYIGYECFQNILFVVRPAYVSCIVQVNTGSEFVSDSPYTYVFDGLASVHHPMEESALASVLLASGFQLTGRLEKGLPNAKKLVCLDFKGGWLP